MGYNEGTPTAAAGDNDDSPASTAFVQQELDVVKTWPFLHVRQSSAQVISSATTTTIDFNSVVVDTDGGYNTSTDVYTVPETGVYHITLSAGWVVAAASVQGEYKLMIYLNSSRGPSEFVDTSAAKETIPIAMGVSTHWNLTAGSTIEGRVYQNTGSNRTMEATALTTNMTIKKVGEV